MTGAAQESGDQLFDLTESDFEKSVIQSKKDFVIQYFPQSVSGTIPLEYEPAWEYAFVATALVSEKTSWSSGKLYFVYSNWVGTHYDWVYTKDCRRCVKKPTTNMIRACSLSSRKEITDKKLQETLNGLLNW